MLVVFPSRPGVVEAADSRTQGMAVSSTVTLASAWPTTMLPSLACHVGPAKWVMMSLPWSSKRFARGTAELVGCVNSISLQISEIGAADRVYAPTQRAPSNRARPRRLSARTGALGGTAGRSHAGSHDWQLGDSGPGGEPNPHLSFARLRSLPRLALWLRKMGRMAQDSRALILGS